MVEIDNTRTMQDNKKKLQAYSEILPKLKDAVLLIYTSTETRKQKFQSWLRQYKINGEVKTYEEII